MKNMIKKYYGLIIAICGILFSIFAYLGMAYQLHLVMLIGFSLSFVLLGVCVRIRDNIRKNEKDELITELKTSNEKLISTSAEKLMQYISDNAENINTSTQQFNNALAQKIYQFIETIPKQTQELILPVIDQNISLEINKCNSTLDLLKNDMNKSHNAVIEILNKNSNDTSEMQKNILSQIAILHRQNSHMMMLTTMIGTVRSDIAATNEVREFKDEHKAGRKIRHVRDDEHGIFIENLMNSDGIRIEKSVMFKDDKLVFEADFDESGRMTRSKNYSENSGTFTEITYSNGSVTKSILGKIFGSKK